MSGVRLVGKLVDPHQEVADDSIRVETLVVASPEVQEHELIIHFFIGLRKT